MSKRGEHFNSAMIVIVLSIAIVSAAFLSEEKNLTGLAVYRNQELAMGKPNLIVFDDVSYLNTLAPGNYYIDWEGVVYWADHNPMPSVGKISSLTESQKNRKIYIDNEGNIGYLFE